MKNKQKVYINEYLSFYPVLLVVANSAAKAKDINKKYMWSDGCDIEDSELEDDALAVTLKLVRRSDRQKVLLVKFNRHDGDPKTKKLKDKDMWRTAVHEAGHVALITYDAIGDNISKNTQTLEPFAYYLEWVTTCIYETISKK